MHQYLKYHVTICILTISLCLAPLFIADLRPRIHATSFIGSLGYVLRTSVTIKVMVGISIGTTLPVMVDVFLDRVSNISFFDLTNTFIIVSVIVVFGTMYLSLNDQYYMAYLYVCFYYMVMIVATSSILYSISQGVIATKGKLSPFLFLIQIIGIAGINIFVVLTMLYPDNKILVLVLTIIRILVGITYSTMQGWWYYSLWRHYQTYKQFGVDEMKETTYMVGELFFFICHVALGFIGATKNNFLYADESFLIMYYIVLIICSVFVTVLPGRLLRKMSEIKETLLRLKREFVRYVSHEIRSPLNVAHAGLELLKADLEAMGAPLLELAVTPLLNVFAGRLEAYKYMALKKNISLRIEDQVQASEYYEGGGASDGSVEDVEESITEGITRNAAVIDARVAVANTLAVDRSAKEKKYPIEQLEDDSVNKTITGFLRFEVVDSGAEGEGIGSTFAVELPIYNRTMDQHAAAEIEIDSVVAFSPSLQPRRRIRATSSARLFPVDDAAEEIMVHTDSGIEGAAEKLSILIVDDSSANRSG
eukprot:gene32344-41909_t